MHELYLSLKILNVSNYDPAYLFKKNRISIQSDNCKETEVASNGAHTFFSLSNYFSSNSIRSFDTTTVEWLSSLEDRLKSRCKCNSTLKTLNHGINSMVYILLSFRLSDTVQNLSNLYETCDREKVEIVSLPGRRSLSPRMSPCRAPVLFCAYYVLPSACYGG